MTDNLRDVLAMAERMSAEAADEPGQLVEVSRQLFDDTIVRPLRALAARRMVEATGALLDRLAQPAPALDVERLARALERIWRSPEGHVSAYAADIAREYASQPVTEEPGDWDPRKPTRYA